MGSDGEDGGVVSRSGVREMAASAGGAGTAADGVSGSLADIAGAATGGGAVVPGSAAGGGAGAGGAAAGPAEGGADGGIAGCGPAWAGGSSVGVAAGAGATGATSTARSTLWEGAGMVGGPTGDSCTVLRTGPRRAGSGAETGSGLRVGAGGVNDGVPGDGETPMDSISRESIEEPELTGALLAAPPAKPGPVRGVSAAALRSVPVDGGPSESNRPSKLIRLEREERKSDDSNEWMGAGPSPIPIERPAVVMRS